MLILKRKLTTRKESLALAKMQSTDSKDHRSA